VLTRLYHNRRRHGRIWCWPSDLVRALEAANRFDGEVLAVLGEMLSSGDEVTRVAAMAVVRRMGSAARSAAGQLLAF
jgi:hypothetical protein